MENGQAASNFDQLESFQLVFLITWTCNFFDFHIW